MINYLDGDATEPVKKPAIIVMCVMMKVDGEKDLF